MMDGRGTDAGTSRRNGAKTWLLSGVPRSGTSLCCRLTGSLPDTVALSEPIRRKAFGGMETPAGACKHIGEFALQVRARILAERRAPSVQVEGCLDDNRRAARHTEAGLRRLGGEWGEIAIEKALTPRFTLLVKHNALFAALLPRIADSFPVLALVRNPLAVLASWQTVDLPVNRGRLPAGEELDPTLRRALAQEAEVLRRQVIILDWFFARYHEHLDSSNILRYEDVVESGGLDLFCRLGHADAPRVALESGDADARWDAAAVDALLRALRERSDAWTHFYRPSECEALAVRMCRRPARGSTPRSV